MTPENFMTSAITPDDRHIESVLLKLLTARSTASSACPSDVARAVTPGDWRVLLPDVRRVASGLALQGKIEITQAGQVVSATGPWKGPIRLRLRGQAAP